MSFFESQGVHLEEEDHRRMFPVTNKSKTITGTLLNRLKELSMTLLLSTRVERLVHKEHKIYGVRMKFGEFHAPAIILITGGRTYPSTGSTRDEYKVVKRMGHTVTLLYATESPLVSDEPYIQEKTLQGLSLQDITLRALNEKGCVLTEHTMDLFFAHFGVSGLATLRCSSFVNKELEKTGEPVTLSLDYFPIQTKQELIRILAEKSKVTKKNLVNVWHDILPERLLIFFLERLEMDHLTGQQTSQKRIQDFVQLCKEFRLPVSKTFPTEKSSVTGGGVSLKEIYLKTLESKIIGGPYFTGGLLDVNGYTGGSNITATFATGYVAGMNTGQGT